MIMCNVAEIDVTIQPSVLPIYIFFGTNEMRIINIDYNQLFLVLYCLAIIEFIVDLNQIPHSLATFNPQAFHTHDSKL